MVGCATERLVLIVRDELVDNLAPILGGDADVTLGSRFLGDAEGIPAGRWALLKMGVAFTYLISRIRVSDVHNGLRAFSRAAAQRLDITMDGMAHASEILDQVKRRGLRYVEVPVHIRYSEYALAKGQSSWNAVRISLQLLLKKLTT